MSMMSRSQAKTKKSEEQVKRRETKTEKSEYRALKNFVSNRGRVKVESPEEKIGSPQKDTVEIKLVKNEIDTKESIVLYL